MTDHLGLAGTLNATFHEPYELARQLATLDHLSGGRAAWNVVTSSDAFTGENFRRGGFLDYADRYVRAGEFIEAAAAVGLVGARRRRRRPASGRVRRAPPGAFEHHGAQFDIRGHFNVPRSPQGHPVILQAGDSDGGRELAAAHRRRHLHPAQLHLRGGQAFYADVKGRLARYGRRRDELKILPGVTFVLGDSPRPRPRRRPATSAASRSARRPRILLLEQVWNRDLSAYDADGPLPDVDPDVVADVDHPGPGPDVTPTRWRPRRSGGSSPRPSSSSIRDLIIEVTGRQSFIGTPAQVADDDRRLRPGATRPTASSSCPTSRRAASTTSSTRSCRCCRSAACCAPSTRPRRCASTWACRRSAPPRHRGDRLIGLRRVCPAHPAEVGEPFTSSACRRVR